MRTPEQTELDRLWTDYESCDDWPAGSRLEVELCANEALGAIDAAKARHELRKQATLDREQRERHHNETMVSLAGGGAPPRAAEPLESPLVASNGAADRREQAAAIAKVAAPWWCFEGAIGSLPTGWCAHTAEACKLEIDGFSKLDQAKVIRTCVAQPLAACVGATKVLQSTRQVDCFATFAGCESFRTHLLSGADYSGVTPCEGTPTPWVPATPATSSPF